MSFVPPSVVFRCLCVAVGLMVATGSLDAQRPMMMTTAEAAQKARVVVAARVLEVQVRRTGNIYTFVDFETIELAKGDVPSRFTYRMLGGKLDDVEVASGAEMPEFVAGEEVILFLGPEISSDGYPTLFTDQVYRITTSRSGAKLVSPAPTGLSVASLGGPAVSASGPSRLADFLNAVKAVK